MPPFERLVFENARHKMLVGHFYAGTGDACIVMSHGLLTDKSSDGRFDEMAHALNQAGYAVLQFDYSGCGESDADTITIDKQVEDLKAAIGLVIRRGYGRLGLYGHCVGSLACLKTAHPAILTMVLAGAITGPINVRANYLNQRHRQVWEEQGQLSVRRDGQGHFSVIERQVGDMVETLSPQALLENIDCPVLLLHGDADDGEKLLGMLSKKAMRYLNPACQLQIIAGADHRFTGCMARVIAMTLPWFQAYLPVSLGDASLVKS